MFDKNNEHRSALQNLSVRSAQLQKQKTLAGRALNNAKKNGLWTTQRKNTVSSFFPPQTDRSRKRVKRLRFTSCTSIFVTLERATGNESMACVFDRQAFKIRRHRRWHLLFHQCSAWTKSHWFYTAITVYSPKRKLVKCSCRAYKTVNVARRDFVKSTKTIFRFALSIRQTQDYLTSDDWTRFAVRRWRHKGTMAPGVFQSI